MIGLIVAGLSVAACVPLAVIRQALRAADAPRHEGVTEDSAPLPTDELADLIDGLTPEDAEAVADLHHWLGEPEPADEPTVDVSTDRRSLAPDWPDQLVPPPVPELELAVTPLTDRSGELGPRVPARPYVMAGPAVGRATVPTPPAVVVDEPRAVDEPYGRHDPRLLQRVDVGWMPEVIR